MSDAVIRVDGLGKRYRIGARAASYRTLRESISSALRAPFGGRSRAGAIGGSSPENLDVWALRDVSFEVAAGEVLGVIGRNGAGKSTLLKILARITPPTEGHAEIRGRVGCLLEVGTGFHPELTGRENVYLSGAILGMKRREIQARFGEIVDFAEMAKFLDTPIKHYSSGMHMRLAFAVAAHLDPEVLLVDEVLAVGDAGFQARCLGKMRSVARGGRTVLFVSHNMAAVSQLCDDAIWIHDGGVRRRGPAAAVVREYVASADVQHAQRTWDDPAAAPGDDRIRLRACRVLQDGVATPVADINRGTWVEIEFDVLRACRDLITGVSLYDPGGQCVFNCCDWRPNEMAPGRYRKAMEIPPQTLAEGRFVLLVQCVFVDPNVQSVVLPDALSFDAIDSEHPQAVRGRYTGDWPGLLRLRLPWTDSVRLASPAQAATPR